MTPTDPRGSSEIEPVTLVIDLDPAMVVTLIDVARRDHVNVATLIRRALHKQYGPDVPFV